MPIDIQPIISQYHGLDAAQVEPLGGAGGFSGAKFWRITLGGAIAVKTQTLETQQFCLRQWPAEHPTKEHLRWIHNLLAHTSQHGLKFVPVPIRNQAENSFCEYGGHLWEVSPWMPGRADFCETVDDACRQTRLTNAMQALALWHNATATFQPPTNETSRGIRSRRQRHQELCSGTLADLGRSVRDNRFAISPDIVSTATGLLDAFGNATDLSSKLDRVSNVAVSLQPCIRDIWHDHVLFTGDKVTGIVDFGAARVAAREGDVARLLGSLSRTAKSDHQKEQLWAMGMSSYQATANQPIHAEMVQIWHLANVSMSGLQWVEWLFSEGRRFDNLEAVHERMRGFLSLQKRP